MPSSVAAIQRTKRQALAGSLAPCTTPMPRPESQVASPGLTPALPGHGPPASTTCGLICSAVGPAFEVRAEKASFPEASMRTCSSALPAIACWIWS